MSCFLAAYDLRSMACHTKIRVLAIALALRKIRRAKSRYLARREFQTLEGVLSFDRAWPLLFGIGIDSCQRLRHTKLSARQANLSSACEPSISIGTTQTESKFPDFEIRILPGYSSLMIGKSKSQARAQRSQRRGFTHPRPGSRHGLSVTNRSLGSFHAGSSQAI
jgi:hypothetical protein